MTAAAHQPAASLVRIVASYTNPRVTYTVSADSCTCPSFGFGRRKDPAFICKHIRREFTARAPRAFVCGTCGQAPAAAGTLECWTCLNHRRDERAELRLANWGSDLEAEPAPFVPFCGCVRCGGAYRYSEASPLLCPACALAERNVRALAQAALAGTRRAAVE